MSDQLKKRRPSRPVKLGPGSDEAAFKEQLDKIAADSDRAGFISKVFGRAAEIAQANSVLVAQAVFEEFRKPEGKRDEKRLVQFMNLALKGRSVDLGYNRFRFDGARAALENAAQLQEINKGGGDEREKIEKAIALLFGEKPSGFVVDIPKGAA